MEPVIPPLSPVTEGLLMALVIFQALQEMCVLEDLIDQQGAGEEDDHDVDTLKELEDESSESDMEREEEIDFDFEGCSIPDLIEDETEDRNSDEEEEEEEDEDLLMHSSSDEEGEEGEEEDERGDADNKRDFLYDNDIDIDLFTSDDDGYEEDSDTSVQEKKSIPIDFAAAEETERARQQELAALMEEVKQDKVAAVYERLGKTHIDVNASVNNADCTLFHVASTQSNAPIVRALLEYAADISFNNNQRSFLTNVMLNRNWAVAELLMRAGGVDIDECTTSRVYAPLTLAVLQENKMMTQLLLDEGANINATNKGGFSTLCCAADLGNETLTQLLLERGCNANKSSVEGISPLHLAAANGHGAIARALIRFRADPSLRTKDGKTPADLAMRRGSFALARDIGW